MNLLNDFTDSQQTVEFMSVESSKLERLNKNNKIIRDVLNLKGSSQMDNNQLLLKKLITVLSSTIDKYSNKLKDYFTDKDWRDIEIFFEELYELDSDLENTINETFQIINDLKKNKTENNLREKVIALIDLHKNHTIAVISNYPDKIFQSEFLQVACMKPNVLVRENKFYDLIIYIGTPYLYQKMDTVFLGKRIIYLSYNFYKNTMSKLKFTNSISLDANQIYKNVKLIENKNIVKKDAYQRETTLSELELMNIQRWIEINNLKNIGDEGRNNNLEENEELVDAKIIQLENNYHYVVLPQSNLRKINVKISSDDDKIIRLNKINLSKLKRNDWILLKTDTEEEYLVRRAKEKYGLSVYESQLSLVAKYKKKLKNKKDHFHTYNKLMHDLRNNNINAASTVVVRSWVTNTIRPGNLRDILKYLGFKEDMITKIDFAAKFINDSHRKVGREMGSRLNNYLEKIDINQLEEAMLLEGEYVFSLRSIGQFRVVTIKNILNDEIKVNQKDLYRLFNTNEELYYE